MLNIYLPDSKDIPAIAIKLPSAVMHDNLIYKETVSILKHFIQTGADISILCLNEVPVNCIGHSIAERFISPAVIEVKMTGFDGKPVYFDEDGFINNLPFGYFEPETDMKKHWKGH
jgi:hypothetical protein